ncbi:MAG: RHS repeat-associated core domain-containing protein, partial [Ruminococcaceae bacterium]|nr:RHS repeat-associated core domain-containing protein [Oscillospiraceae bacterium]
FQKNLQGDVIAITNSYGNVVARYTYDAWGVCTVVSDETGIIARVNPFRYRGYYYDSEIGLYYLQSRYYDPQVGRFVNGDECDNIGVSRTVCSHCLFAYYENNPINNTDKFGFFSWIWNITWYKNILCIHVFKKRLSDESIINASFKHVQ